MFVETPEDAYRVLQEELLPGDLVLFKSSNGAGLRFLGDQVAQSAGQAGSQPAEEEGLPA